MAPLSGAFAQSGGNRRCRFIVHIADLSALGLLRELPECTPQQGCHIDEVGNQGLEP